jgi:hypothetical protein
LIEKQAFQLSTLIFLQRFMTEHSIHWQSFTSAGGSQISTAPMMSQDTQGPMTFAQFDLGAAFSARFLHRLRRERPTGRGKFVSGGDPEEGSLARL